MSDPAQVRRGDVVVAELPDPRGHEMRKRRPCVVISPDDMNEAQFTYLLVPLTTGRHPFRYRVPCSFQGQAGHIVLDQVWVSDASQVSSPIGKLPASTMRDALARLREMFAE